MTPERVEADLEIRREGTAWTGTLRITRQDSGPAETRLRGRTRALALAEGLGVLARRATAGATVRLSGVTVVGVAVPGPAVLALLERTLPAGRVREQLDAFSKLLLPVPPGSGPEPVRAVHLPPDPAARAALSFRPPDPEKLRAAAAKRFFGALPPGAYVLLTRTTGPGAGRPVSAVLRTVDPSGISYDLLTTTGLQREARAYRELLAWERA